ncbi:sigma-54 interaction domain-containing protein [Bacillus marasmi]|uniref:sigma-54 interaction domain-containing protein n=1 Tax=Bacillus marasmi TaxID=1926279 RepID=UPI0011C9CA25|nr:sigma 54-interacting transcriptional regulator [Bacillus marasmi]
MNVGIDKIPRQWVEEILNLSGKRIVVVDTDGTICYINAGYCQFLGIKPEDALGRPVQDVIENTRMHIVVKTGKPELAALQPIKGSEMIANRYPIIIDDELVGAFGTVMFGNPDEVKSYKEKIDLLIEELNFYKTQIEKDVNSKYSFHDLIGRSQTFLNARKLAEKVSVSMSSILLIGESGTGKELFAHAIHNNSPRAFKPFVPINCASIPEHLLESELFGYEDGSFTGAKKGGKKGLFQLANKGTIFLDEIGDMPLSMQSKLLRALQEKEIQPVGGQKSIKIDVRIIAATHRDLEKMVEEGKFRQDLYYRLNVIKIDIPPLRDRKGDIELLSKKLVEKLEKKFYRKGISISPEVIARLQQHSWPGNIRELENVLERAINVLTGRQIELIHLPLYIRDLNVADEPFVLTDDSAGGVSGVSVDSTAVQMPPTVGPLKDTIAFVEKQAILSALKVADGNKIQAAKLLEIGKTRFYEKCKVYGIK